VLKNSSLVFLFDSQLHLTNLELALQLIALFSEDISIFLFLSLGILGLFQVSSEVFDLLLLLPEK